jgi:hypothetical protein
MSANRPLRIPGRRLVLTKNKILESQKHTKSNMAAARWIGVSYNTYKKWAKFYDVFDQHLNPKGIGVKKGWATYKISLDKVFETGELPKSWSHKVFKKNLINDGYLEEECSSCSYSEVNVSTETICLALDFIDDIHKNFKQDNIRLLCPNCYLSYNGRFPSSKTFCK